ESKRLTTSQAPVSSSSSYQPQVLSKRPERVCSIGVHVALASLGGLLPPISGANDHCSIVEGFEPRTFAFRRLVLLDLAMVLQQDFNPPSRAGALRQRRKDISEARR